MSRQFKQLSSASVIDCYEIQVVLLIKEEKIEINNVYWSSNEKINLASYCITDLF